MAIALFMARSADAFDSWGFESGMSVARAKAVASQMGYKVAIDGDGHEAMSTIGFYSSDVEAQAGIGYVGSFCNGQLTGISQFVKGTMGTFIDTLEDLKHVYGRPLIDTSSEMLVAGRYRWLKLEYAPKSNDKVVMVVRTTPGSDADFRVSVSHSAGGGCEKLGTVQ